MYTIGGQVGLVSGPGGVGALQILLTPAAGPPVILVRQTLPNASGAGFTLNVSTVYKLAAGDRLTLQVLQSTGGAATVSHLANFTPEFYLARL